MRTAELRDAFLGGILLATSCAPARTSSPTPDSLPTPTPREAFVGIPSTPDIEKLRKDFEEEQERLRQTIDERFTQEVEMAFAQLEASEDPHLVEVAKTTRRLMEEGEWRISLTLDTRYNIESRRIDVLPPRPGPDALLMWEPDGNELSYTLRFNGNMLLRRTATDNTTLTTYLYHSYQIYRITQEKLQRGERTSVRNDADRLRVSWNAWIKTMEELILLDPEGDELRAGLLLDEHVLLLVHAFNACRQANLTNEECAGLVEEIITPKSEA